MSLEKARRRIPNWRLGLDSIETIKSSIVQSFKWWWWANCWWWQPETETVNERKPNGKWWGGNHNTIKINKWICNNWGGRAWESCMWHATRQSHSHTHTHTDAALNDALRLDGNINFWKILISFVFLSILVLRIISCFTISWWLDARYFAPVERHQNNKYSRLLNKNIHDAIRICV